MDALTVISPETHDRQKLIGGSDIAAILGISPWKTPLDLWTDKTTPRAVGHVEDESQLSIPIRRGRALENLVGDLLVESLIREGHDVTVFRRNERYRDADHPMFASEIDVELSIDGELVNGELKTASAFASRAWGPSGGDELPIHYLAQVQWGLGITNRRRAYVGALIGDDFRTYEIQADDATISALRMRALAFWQQHVLAGVAPDPKTLTDLALLFPTESKDGPPLLADEYLIDRVLRLRACKDEIGARESEADALEYEIKRAMRDASELILPNGKSPVEWKTKSGNSLDGTSLKVKHPAIYRECLKPWTARVFRLKAFDTKGIW